MKWISLFAVCALALLVNACEQHPTPGEPPVREHGAEAEKHEGAAEAAKPAEGAKPEEAPKFFPDKK